MLRKLCLWILKVCGWQTINNLPEAKKYVIIAAPHTSNWDFPLGMLYIVSSGVPFRFMGKDALFKWPQKYLFKALGGFAVDRGQNTKFTTKMANYIQAQDEIALALAPEGTRSKSKYWKTGFYYIAMAANIPIALAYFDFDKKVVGIGFSFMPCGAIDQDMEIIRNFLKD
ncbi:MAG: 1-acyl-sn-glycerol-3-phosphate acyltransferase, partial [Proteobacteria bacterium]|nr:1-acyl-sn-glycerol-3-phosphate acyltransferase [Pseudomonadota bacterium]